MGERHVRLQATVRYDTAAVAAEQYWFDIPAELEQDVTTSGNPWFACLLPLAAQSGEALRIRLPVDRILFENAAQVLRIWRTWYPELHVVPLHGDLVEPMSGLRPGRVAAFFSGGVDSFFTAVRARDHAAPPERMAVNDLITVWGFDIPLHRPDAFARLRARYAEVAESLGMQWIDVATNLRTTRWQNAHWSRLAHGAALASVVLAMERRFHTGYIPGSGSYRDMHPWGSHYISDPLFSTGTTSIVFDGAAYLRTHKIAHIADDPRVLRHLRICFESESDENCGTCDKCLRTMLVLELCGVLERCATLPPRIDVATVAHIDCRQAFMRRELEDIHHLAVDRHRYDLAHAIEQSLRRSERRARLRRGIRALGSPVRALARRMGWGA